MTLRRAVLIIVLALVLVTAVYALLVVDRLMNHGLS